ncbi:MAG: gamma-glutamyltransferase [Salinisphaeraceae bacterium]
MIRSLVLWLTLAGAAGMAAAVEPPPGAAVASAHPAATEAGIEILEAGGNAFDAAVAVSAALAVVEPQGSGLGGGGFWLLHQAGSGRNVMVDGREEAPAAATEDMYLDEDDDYVSSRSKNGPLAAGIPGEPAALAHIAEKYGELPLAESLAPAIRLARDGFAIGDELVTLLHWRATTMKTVGGVAGELFLPGGVVPDAGFVLKQPALADTLTRLAEQGRDGFYAGPVAEALVEGVRAAGGIWQLSDLAEYDVIEREPIVSRFRDMTLIGAPPPSSGGVVLAEALNILDRLPWSGLSEVKRRHLVVEAMRRAYRDRAAYLGDPDFVDMPIDRLISGDYAAGLRVGISLERATSSDSLAPATADVSPGTDTTHFSVMDAAGNRVAATLSVNYPFGSGFMPAGTGVVLNNEMDDFSAKPLTPNGYGLIGTGANAIAPGKRPLSSMSPSFVEAPDRTLVIGTPGGSRIISMVLLGILEFAEGADAQAIAALPRYHHQFRPDHIYFEPDALSDADRDALKAMGHALELSDRDYGDMQVVIHDRAGNRLETGSDPRGIGVGKVLAAEEDD